MAKDSNVEHSWYVVDASGQTLGRLASNVATVLRGKHKPTFTPHVDTGDFVVVINTDKVVMTGKKLEQKLYRKHTGYIGNLKETPYSKLMETRSDFVVYEAIRRMLPKNSLGSKTISKLKVYKGSEHSHAAQKPQQLKFN